MKSRRLAIVLVSLIATFVVLRVLIGMSPNSDFDVAGYNIHHLFTGLLLITAGAIPLALFDGDSLPLTAARALLGIGLGMALDEWAYLIATDGSNASYLLPVSFRGGVVMIALASAYAIALARTARKRDEGNNA